MGMHPADGQEDAVQRTTEATQEKVHCTPGRSKKKKTPTGTSPPSPRSVSALSLLSVLSQLQALCHCDEALRLRSIHSCTPNNARVSTRFRKHTVTFIILCVPAILLSACKIWLLNSHPNSYMTPLRLPSASQSVDTRTKMHAAESRLLPRRKCHLWARPHVCSTFVGTKTRAVLSNNDIINTNTITTTTTAQGSDRLLRLCW